MKVPMQILRVSAGKIEESGMLYANAIVLDSEVANQIDTDRIDVGQQHAKVKMSTENENQLAKELAKSGLVPSTVMCEVKTTVKKGEVAMMIIGFESKAKAA